MSLLKGIDRMRDMLLEKRNVLRAGFRPTTRCCGGARHGQIVAGQALHATVNATHARCKGGDGQLKLIEIHRQDIESLPDLMVLMRGAPYRFIVHLDTALVVPRKAFAKCNRRNLSGLCERCRVREELEVVCFDFFSARSAPSPPRRSETNSNPRRSAATASSARDWT